MSCWFVDFATCLFQDDKASEDTKSEDTDTKKEEEKEKGSSKDCRQLLALGVIKAVGIIGCSFCINNFSAVLVRL